MMYYRISKNEKILFFGKKIALVWALTLSYKSYKTLKMQVTQDPQLKLQVIQDTQVASYTRPSTQVTSYKTLKMQVTQGPQLKLQLIQEIQYASYTSSTQVTNYTWHFSTRHCFNLQGAQGTQLKVQVTQDTQLKLHKALNSSYMLHKTLKLQKATHIRTDRSDGPQYLSTQVSSPFRGYI